MLRVVSDSQSTHLPPFLSTAQPVKFAVGFYEAEEDESGSFRWMEQQASLTFAALPGERFLELRAFSEFHDLSQTLTIRAAGSSAGTQDGTQDRIVAAFPLTQGWQTLSVVLPAGVAGVDLEVNKLFPQAYYPQDSRRLAIRLWAPKAHGDPQRHGHIRSQQENSIANVREMNAGATVLSSTPRMLGIDMYGVCNVKPPCVYCDWQHAKDLEGDQVEAPFDHRTLEEWGEFFDNSSMLVNCSIGEPFMMKNFDSLLDTFGNQGKFVELTTNGQILTDRNIEKLLGRNIHLYISLDASNGDTYAKLRNENWDRMIGNIRRLIRAKREANDLPRVFVVFMPMKLNVSELEDFVKLCAELQVDRLILRPLNWAETSDLTWDRNGHHYDYLDQLLPFEELVRISGRAAALCERYGVALSDQLDFGGDLESAFEEGYEEGRNKAGEKGVLKEPTEEPAFGAADSQVSAVEPRPSAPTSTPLPSLGNEANPPCLEPWKSLYILRRGVMPCCYGAEPIAPMTGYRETWNSQLMQDIRSDLVSGTFHTYCQRSKACPIVRKAQASQELTFSGRSKKSLLRAIHQVDRWLGGSLKKVYHLARPSVRA
ncbi:MAG: radical SAM protein [Deltaproteobacteria bacterium]|nr:radical SAM protein [Deltaproteobacteria bacterium]